MSDERPSSFGQALESSGYDASGTSSSVPDDTVTDSSADASSASNDSDPALDSSDAATPAALPTEAPLAAEPPPGPLPYARHKAILDKAYAERDSYKTQVEQTAWAQQVPAEVGPRFVEMARRHHGDPVGFALELATELQGNPQHAAAFRSHLGRLLGQRAQQAPPLEDAPPAPDIVVDGHKWYSAEQQAKRDEWLTRQLAGQMGSVVDERVGPLAALAKRVADAEAQQQADTQAQAFASTHFDKVSKLPGFKEHQAEISAAFDAELAKVPKDQWDSVSPMLLRDAYTSVVLPKLTTDSNAHLLKTLTAKAVTGSLGTRPTVAATATRPKSWSDAFSQAGVS